MWQVRPTTVTLVRSLGQRLLSSCDRQAPCQVCLGFEQRHCGDLVMVECTVVVIMREAAVISLIALYRSVDLHTRILSSDDLERSEAT